MAVCLPDLNKNHNFHSISIELTALCVFKNDLNYWDMKKTLHFKCYIGYIGYEILHIEYNLSIEEIYHQ